MIEGFTGGDPGRLYGAASGLGSDVTAATAHSRQAATALVRAAAAAGQPGTADALETAGLLLATAIEDTAAGISHLAGACGTESAGLPKAGGT
jgi:hypothetical protein